jgi:hypothetical protein
MVNPSGYTALDLIGYTDKGTYNAAETYVKNDLVHYNGNIWRVLIDDTTGVTPTEGANYTIFVETPTDAFAESIAPVESAVSTHAYTIGQQLYYSDKLYRVIANIALGDTLTVETNITESDKVTSQIQALANNVSTNTSNIQTLTNSIAPIEDGTNYSHSYSQNQLFYHNGSLCYVTASSVNSSIAINIGESGNAKYCTLEWYLSKMELGVRLEHTWQASELANVSSGSIQVINRDGVCCVKCVNLVCTADAPLLYIGGYVGNVYEYDTDNSGLYIDNGTLYSKNANVGMRILTFVR